MSLSAYFQNVASIHSQNAIEMEIVIHLSKFQPNLVCLHFERERVVIFSVFPFDNCGATEYPHSANTVEDIYTNPGAYLRYTYQFPFTNDNFIFDIYLFEDLQLQE
jgi:hypothetical protein